MNTEKDQNKKNSPVEKPSVHRSAVKSDPNRDDFSEGASMDDVDGNMSAESESANQNDGDGANSTNTMKNKKNESISPREQSI